MPSVLQIQKLCFHHLGRATALLMLTLCLVSTLSAAEPTTKPRLRIHPVTSQKTMQPSATIRQTGGTAPSTLKPVVKAAAMTLLQPEPPAADPTPIVPPIVEPAAPTAPTLQVDAPMPMPMVDPPVAPLAQPMSPPAVSPSDSAPSAPQPLPSLANDRGRLTGKPDSFFESLTPEDRELLYDGKLPDQFGIGRTFDYEIDGKEVTPPTNIAAKVFSQEPVEDFPNGYHRDWYPMVAMWEAPALYHRPLYFEEVNLERYGHTHKHLQPVFSAAHFFGNTLALPYKMGAYPPCERIYTLGHYRPGDCNPHDIHTTPFTWKGVIYTGAVYSGVGAAFP